MRPSEFGFAALPPVVPVNPMYEYAGSSMPGPSSGQAGHIFQRMGSFQNPGAFRRMDSQEHLGAFRRMDSQETVIPHPAQGSEVDQSSVGGKNNSSDSSFSAIRMYFYLPQLKSWFNLFS